MQERRAIPQCLCNEKAATGDGDDMPEGCAVPLYTSTASRGICTFGLVLTKDHKCAEPMLYFGKAIATTEIYRKSKPELVHSETCTQGRCEACVSSSTCWHGSGGSGGAMSINKAQPGSDYTCSLLADCSADATEWFLWVFKVDSGKIVLEYGGKKCGK